jgi:ABC-type Fe3+/spermidine/putrescine transport system ATPase subunit
MSIAGLIDLDGGEVRVDNEVIGDHPVEDRDLGVVFQDFEDRLFPHMTVEENIAFGLQQNPDIDDTEIDDRVTEVLNLLAIERTRADTPPELSGGQQQRVDLARQLVRDVGTLLLDDPLSDLDYKLQKYLELELRRIHSQQEKTVLYVTHNQDQSFKLADRLVVFNQGRIEQASPPTEIYHNPETAFVARFVGDSNMFAVEQGPDGSGRNAISTPLGEMDIGEQTAKEAPRPDGAGTTENPAGVAMVRPEALTFADGPNAVTGTLEQRTYTGEMTEFIISLSADVETFQAHQRGNVGLEELGVTIGDEVTLSWQPEQMQYFDQGQLSETDSVSVSEILKI